VTSIWLAAIVFASSAGQPVRQSSKEEYSPKGGDFTIVFPAKPKESNQIAKSPIGDVKVYTATYATSDGDIFMVSYSDLGEEATKPNNLKSLFDGVRAGAKGQDGEVLDDDPIKFDSTELHGRSLELEKGKQRVKLRAIVRGQRLYQIVVVGSLNFTRSKEAVKFLDSFKTTAK
jgi:hypothetical protein